MKLYKKIALLGLVILAPNLLGFAAGMPEESIAPGPYQPSWDSLGQYQFPEWFRDAKFGIWAHWSAQCVPEMGDWYAKHMYDEYIIGKISGKKFVSKDYHYHLEHYGHPSEFGFKDIDNLWHCENWNPEELLNLYKDAGAKYFVALANHHDNLDCYDSKYQKWNSVNIGPKKDIVGLWAKAARTAGLRFGVTVHAARTWDWFDVSHGADIDGPKAGVPYDGNLTLADGKGKWWEGYDPAELYGPAGSARTEQAHLAYDVKFFNRTIDLINKYQPDLLYFDDHVLPLEKRPGNLGLKIAAHYYNSNLQWHGKNEAVMNTKNLDDNQRKCLIRDIERGKNDVIDPSVWQTDTCIGEWHYDRNLAEKHHYKKASDVVPMLADIVSKNGNLLLNVPLRGDGSIDDDERQFLVDMANWMKFNGESIFGTRPWKIFGEGPSTTSEEKGLYGGQKDVAKTPFTAEDIRFTTKGNALYAIVLGWPENGNLTIQSLSSTSTYYSDQIQSVELLGGGKIDFKRDSTGLHLTFPKQKPCEIAWSVKITSK